MDKIVRNLEEIELTEAELETICGATGECAGECGLEKVRGLEGLFGQTGTHTINITGTSFFTSTCNDFCNVLVTVTVI